MSTKWVNLHPFMAQLPIGFTQILPGLLTFIFMYITSSFN